VTRVPVKLRRSALVPTGFAAWVPLKRTVLVSPGAIATQRLIAHELAHVHQAERNAWPAAYIWQWIRTGFSYHRMPFEVEARAAEREPFYLAWATDVLRAWSDE
jgi:hypothetical protein